MVGHVCPQRLRVHAFVDGVRAELAAAIRCERTAITTTSLSSGYPLCARPSAVVSSRVLAAEVLAILDAVGNPQRRSVDGVQRQPLPPMRVGAAMCPLLDGRRNSHSIGSAPSRARACTSALDATVRLPSGAGSAISSCRATAVIGSSRMTAIPSTSHTVRSAGIRRRRIVAVPVASNASSIHAGSRCWVRFGNVLGVNSEVNSSASVNVSWTGVTIAEHDPFAGFRIVPRPLPEFRIPVEDLRLSDRHWI